MCGSLMTAKHCIAVSSNLVPSLYAENGEFYLSRKQFQNRPEMHAHLCESGEVPPSYLDENPNFESQHTISSSRFHLAVLQRPVICDKDA